MQAIVILENLDGSANYLRTCGTVHSTPGAWGVFNGTQAVGTLGKCRRRSLAKRFANATEAEDWVSSLHFKETYSKRQGVSFARVVPAAK